MEIKEFKVISSNERKELYNFIKNIDSTYNKAYIEMTRIYESNIFNDGSTVFIVFYKGKIRGSIALITKEICITGEAFITDIYIEKEDIKVVLKILIKRIVEYCKMCKAKSIKLGVRESETLIIPYVNKLGFNHIYDAVVMVYSGDENMDLKSNKDMELRPLCISNSKDYISIYNDTFINSPNGGSIDEVEVKDYIVQYANNEDLIGLCFVKNKFRGIYELSIDDNTGWIDTLAISPIYQNGGLGSSLIRNCIKKLYDKNMYEIKLLVITSNDIAVSMYKEMEFKEERVFSYWFEIIL